MYKNTKNKFENLWENVVNLKSDSVKYYSTKQLLYMSIILENAIRKKKGPNDNYAYFGFREIGENVIIINI